MIFPKLDTLGCQQILENLEKILVMRQPLLRFLSNLSSEHSDISRWSRKNKMSVTVEINKLIIYTKDTNLNTIPNMFMLLCYTATMKPDEVIQG